MARCCRSCTPGQRRLCRCRLKETKKSSAARRLFRSISLTTTNGKRFLAFPPRHTAAHRHASRHRAHRQVGPDRARGPGWHAGEQDRIETQTTSDLLLIHPSPHHQWVGTPALAGAVSNAGGLGILTALTQPSPDALREAIRKTRAMLKPEVLNRSTFGAFGVNITLLPSINPPDYPGYAKAALDEGVRIFETAGNSRACSYAR